MNARPVATLLLAGALLVLSREAAPQASEAPLASAESSSDAAALFRHLDANGDGVLSAEELAAPPAARGNWLAVDRNRDGRITEEEFGIVSNFASRPSSAATGGTQGAETKGEARP
jgi:hypothetical protein